MLCLIFLCQHVAFTSWLQHQGFPLVCMFSRADLRIDSVVFSGSWQCLPVTSLVERRNGSIPYFDFTGVLFLARLKSVLCFFSIRLIKQDEPNPRSATALPGRNFRKNKGGVQPILNF